MHPTKIFLISTPLSHLSWVCESFREDIGELLILNFFFSLKIYLFMKNLTDFRETAETVVDPRLAVLFKDSFTFFHVSLSFVASPDD